MEFAYDGGGLGKGGTATLYLDGEQVGEGRVDATAAMIFSADDTCDVGVEGGARGLGRLRRRTATPSPARSTGSRSTSTRPPRTTTT